MNGPSNETRNYSVLAISVWFLSALVGGWFDIFSMPGKPPLFVGLFLVLPILSFTTMYTLSARFRTFANSIPLSLIVGAHLWRYVGLGFIFVYLLGKLPGEFAIPEGVGDVVAAAFALPLARALHRKRPVRGYFLLWNIFGLIDLISAITVGILFSQGSFGILRTGVSTAFMTAFPVNVIPTFFVPLFILLHMLALARRNEVERTVGSRISFANGTS
jgi:hypothetical protein